MWEWLRRGWRYRWERMPHMRANKQAYLDRMNYEMSVITKKDYCDYFLVTAEAVQWAKDVPEVPVGPARGSAAGCLIAYLMRITEVNPMLFPTMMFERFIDEGRADPPDIDLDFADDRRYLLREHLVDKYGADHVGNIGNFTKYRGKNSIDDVARVHRIPKYEAKIVKDLVIERSGGDSRFDASLGDTREMFPQAAAVFERHPNLEYAIRLEGNYKSMGVHAAGLVVSQDPISATCATYEREVRGHKVDILAYDKKDAEYLNMLKMDFLGLSTMGMIDIALRMIGMKLDDLYKLPLDDPETLAAFTRADVVGIFQFDGRATRLMTMDVVPTTFMEIADINALSRPGPLFSGASAKYVEVKHGRAEPEHLHPIVDKWTSHSKFQIIYQEQVLSILRDMGGFPGSVTGALRKIISLKLGEAQFNEWYQAFIDGAKKHHGVEHDLADKIWKLMVTSATYSFNIAHCISYGMLAYWCMWIKVHHPMAFYCAQLTKKTNKEDWPVLIKDAQKHGIEVLPPDLRHAQEVWSPHPNGKAIHGGLRQVPGIGEKTASQIIEHLKEHGRPKTNNWAQLSVIKGIGPKTTAKIQKWADSEDPYNLWYAERVLGDLRDAIAKRRLYVALKPNIKSDEIPRDADQFPVTWMGIPNKREYKDFIEDERARSGREPEDILKTMKSPDKIKSCVVKAYDDGDEEVYLRFNRFKFPAFKDMLEGLKVDGSQVVIAKGKKNKGFGINVQVEQLLVIDIAEEDDEEDALIEAS
jgi:DNA polymerase-3 subunit alpha